MLELFETLAPLGKADDESSWCDTLWTVGRQMGFEQMLFAALPRPGLDVGSAFLRSNYAAQWRQSYDAQRMVQIDPTVAHCFTRTVPLLWAPDLFSTPAQKSMYEEACGFGLRSGITLPMHGPKGEAGMLCFVTDAATSPQLMRDFQNCLGQLTLVRDIAFDAGRFRCRSSGGRCSRSRLGCGRRGLRLGLRHRHRMCVGGRRRGLCRRIVCSGRR